MNIDKLFNLVAQKATVKAFRDEMKRQLEEAAAAKAKVRAEEAKSKRRGASKKDTSAGEGDKEDASLITFLNQKNKEGNTLLHSAVSTGSFELVEELIGLGVELDTKNRAGKTALELSELGAGKNHQSIKALLKTRGNWVKIAKGYNVNRVIHMLQQAEPEVKKASGKPKLLFIGPSGSGKSTLMNARFGVTYGYHLAGGCRPEAKVIRNGDKAVAPVGHGIHSTTIFPYARTLPSNSFAHVDLAGLFDNRGHEHKIVAASTTQWVASMPGGIQGILVFIDLPTLQAKRAEGLREVADALHKMCDGNVEILKSVRYVVTKISPENIRFGMTPEAVKNEFLEELLEDAEDKNNKSVEFMLNDMVNNLGKIFLDDLSPESGNAIDNEFKGLNPLSSDNFNFMLHDNAQVNFKGFLVDLPTKYLDIKRRINVIPSEITATEKTIAALEKSAKDLADEVKNDKRQIESVKNDTYQPKEDDTLSTIKTKLTANDVEIKTKKDEITDLQDKIRAKQIAKKVIDTDNRSLFHTAHQSGFAYKARPSVNVNWVFGAPVIRMSSSFRGWNGLSSRLNYPNPTGQSGIDPYDGVTVQWVDDPEGVGRYDRDFFGGDGVSEYTVDFWVQERYLPQNRQKIANFNQEISVLSTQLQHANQDLKRLSAEKVRLDKDKKDFTNKIKQEHLKSLADSIQRKEQTITSNKSEIVEKKKSIEDLKAEKVSLELELDVNKNLFKTVSQILEDLNIYEINTNEFILAVNGKPRAVPVPAKPVQAKPAQPAVETWTDMLVRSKQAIFGSPQKAAQPQAPQRKQDVARATSRK